MYSIQINYIFRYSLINIIYQIASIKKGISKIHTIDTTNFKIHTIKI